MPEKRAEGAQEPAATHSAAAKQRVTWAECVRDIVVRAMELGQLVPLGLLVVVVACVWRMSPTQLDALARDLLGALKQGELVAYPMVVTATLGWFFHVRWVRRGLKAELKRVGTEKSRLQSMITEKQLSSSEESE